MTINELLEHLTDVDDVEIYIGVNGSVNLFNQRDPVARIAYGDLLIGSISIVAENYIEIDLKTTIERKKPLQA